MRIHGFLLVLALAMAQPALGLAQDEPADRPAPGTGQGGQDAPPRQDGLQAEEGAGNAAGKQEPEQEKSPEEKMRARFPQPVIVGDLIGLDVIDAELRALGRVEAVVESGGRLQFVITYSRLLGFSGRKVPLPIEALAMLGDRVMLVDIPRNEVEMIPTWYGSRSRELARQEVIRVGITSR